MFFAVLAFLVNIRRLGHDNPRRWLRIPALAISVYVFIVFFLAFIGVIPDDSIRLFMRWFWTAAMMYIVAEAWNG